MWEELSRVDFLRQEVFNNLNDFSEFDIFVFITSFFFELRSYNRYLSRNIVDSRGRPKLINRN